MPSSITFHYRFTFHIGDSRNITLSLDSDTLELIPDARNSSAPSWAELSFHRCPVCRLDPVIHRCCPIAVHLSRIIDLFKDHFSYEEVSVAVSDSMRTYIKETSLQDALGSMLGIVMTSGGCPTMEPLRPMVRFHLPFASVEETEFRMVSMYLLAQYYRSKKGLEADWELEGLLQIYDRVRDVNRSFAGRIRAATVNDAGINSIVMLDNFAEAVPFAIRTSMRDFEKYFAVYTEKTVPCAGGCPVDKE